jgi:hypothetical protein
MSDAPTRRATTIIDLTNPAWAKVTIPGIVIGISLIAGGVYMKDRVDHRLETLETRVDKTDQALKDVVAETRKLAEIVARLSGVVGGPNFGARTSP